MDEISDKIRQMYDNFPYPSPQAHGRDLRELVNLLTLFSMETRYDFRNRHVLDAGTGTGHRLIKAASRLRKTQFTAIDISETPLSIARRACQEEGLDHIDFRVANLMEAVTLGTFDVILCMGVLHHLSCPARGLRNLVTNLADDGILFLYVYGRHGGRERMRRKQVVSILNGDRDNFRQGISLVKELGFDSFEYGWNLDFQDEASRDALIVDAYLNVNETLYDVEGLLPLLKESGLSGFMTYGLTLHDKGVLFDTRLKEGDLLQATNIASFLKTPKLQERYEMLSLVDKYRLMDLLFEPNGYTLIGFKKGAYHRLEKAPRLVANAILFDTL